jgi:hypothetical protein
MCLDIELFAWVSDRAVVVAKDGHGAFSPPREERV